MNNDESLDLLDMDDGASMDTLPEAPVFAAPRPKKPWLLLGIGALIIILATYIIVRTVSSGSSSSIDVDLDAPAVMVESPTDTIVVAPAPAPDGVPVAAPVQVAPNAAPDAAATNPMVPAPAPVAQPAAPEHMGSPVRVVEDRKPVVFNPDTPAAKPAAPKPVVKPAAKPAPKPKAAAPKKQVSAVNGSWFVQFGSYGTRAAAESAQKKFRNAHPALFQGKQFVILAAVLKDGTTTYRLRIAFASSAEANGFCRNAKSDGVDCYVAK